MKKTYKALLCGAAAVAAVGIAYAMDERFFEKAKDKLTVFKCRANSKIMEQALPLTDAMFPGPKVVSGADSAKKIPEVLKELNVNKGSRSTSHIATSQPRSANSSLPILQAMSNTRETWRPALRPPTLRSS